MNCGGKFPSVEPGASRFASCCLGTVHCRHALVGRGGLDGVFGEQRESLAGAGQGASFIPEIPINVPEGK